MIHITDTTTINDTDIVERFVRAVGPGGQNPRREATAVELRFDIGRSSLPPDVKKRLIGIGGRHVTSNGVLVVVSRTDRSQAKNRETARARLLTLLKRASDEPEPRLPTGLNGATKRLRRSSKERRSEVKRDRHTLEE